jgi:hypothetical protein
MDLIENNFLENKSLNTTILKESLDLQNNIKLLPNDIKLKIYNEHLEIISNFEYMIYLLNNNIQKELKKYIIRLLNDKLFMDYTFKNSIDFKLIFTKKFINLVKKINYNIFIITLFYSKYKFIQFRCNRLF